LSNIRKILFHATVLVFFSDFAIWQQKGDALYYASFFADKIFNPFVACPIAAHFFILVTLCNITVFGAINSCLNRHLPQDARTRLRIRP
jgi:polar amino acid transport system permease protein